MKNEYTYNAVDDTISIHTNSGHDILISARDLERVSKLPGTWSAAKCKYTRYAICCYQGKTIYLHRWLCEMSSGDRSQVIHHKNGNGLDNRRCNIEQTTQSHNIRQAKRRERTLPRNVYYTEKNKFCASITVDKVKHISQHHKTLTGAIEALATLKSQLNLE